MDAGTLREEPTWHEIPWWVGVARFAEPAGFGTAAVMYVLPFFYLIRGEGVSVFASPYTYGIELFFASIAYTFSVPWPPGIWYFGQFGLPLLTAIAGLLLQKGPRRIGALARFFCAVMGLGGLTWGFLQQHLEWQIGFYGAAAGLAVATVAAGLRSVAAFRHPGDEGI